MTKPTNLTRQILQFTGITAIGTVAIGGLLAIGSHLVMNGVILGVLSACGGAILWIKSPDGLKRLLAKGDVLVDAGLTLLAFAAFGITATGLIAAGIFSICMSVVLKANRVANMLRAER